MHQDQSVNNSSCRKTKKNIEQLNHVISELHDLIVKLKNKISSFVYIHSKSKYKFYLIINIISLPMQRPINRPCQHFADTLNLGNFLLGRTEQLLYPPKMSEQVSPAFRPKIGNDFKHR